jgi:hypothetical protein
MNDDLKAYRALRGRQRRKAPGVEIYCNGRGTHDAVYLRTMGSRDGLGVDDYGDSPGLDARLAGERPSRLQKISGEQGTSYRFTCSRCRLDQRAKRARLAGALFDAESRGQTRVLIAELLT